jgi:hypothetical protein
MKQAARRRPSPALAISLIALFVALGGTGYAAVTINGKNLTNKSVAGKKLKNKTITGGKIKNATITGGKIKNGTLTGDKVANGTLTGAKVANESLTGAQVNESTLAQVPNAARAAVATTVNPGAVNASTLGGIVTRQLTVEVANTGGFAQNVACADGERLIGGGVRWTAPVNAALIIQSSGPSNVAPGPDVPLDGEAFTAWRAAGTNNSGATASVVISAICLRP